MTDEEDVTNLAVAADPVDYAEMSTADEISATASPLIANPDHRRSSRSLQLPIRLSSDYEVYASPVRCTPTVASTSAGSVCRAPILIASTSTRTVRPAPIVVASAGSGSSHPHQPEPIVAQQRWSHPHQLDPFGRQQWQWLLLLEQEEGLKNAAFAKSTTKMSVLSSVATSYARYVRPPFNQTTGVVQIARGPIKIFAQSAFTISL